MLDANQAAAAGACPAPAAAGPSAAPTEATLQAVVPELRDMLLQRERLTEDISAQTLLQRLRAKGSRISEELLEKVRAAGSRAPQDRSVSKLPDLMA